MTHSHSVGLSPLMQTDIFTPRTGSNDGMPRGCEFYDVHGYLESQASLTLVSTSGMNSAACSFTPCLCSTIMSHAGCGKSTFMRRMTSVFGGSAQPPVGNTHNPHLHMQNPGVESSGECIKIQSRRLTFGQLIIETLQGILEEVYSRAAMGHSRIITVQLRNLMHLSAHKRLRVHIRKADQFSDQSP